LSETKAPELPNVPLIEEFANARQKQILRLVLSRQIVGRPFAAPPGIPADRAQALRRAFDATLKDKEFLAEAVKVKLDVNPVTGEEVDRLIAQLYATPKDIVEETRAAIKP
jgi:tripartite-type tricarboxylate transporter receptor subunit TctC